MNFWEDHLLQIKKAQAEARLKDIKTKINKVAYSLSLSFRELKGRTIDKVASTFEGAIIILTPTGYFKGEIEGSYIEAGILTPDEMVLYELVDQEHISEYHAARDAFDALNNQLRLAGDMQSLIQKYGKEKLLKHLEG